MAKSDYIFRALDSALGSQARPLSEPGGEMLMHALDTCGRGAAMSLMGMELVTAAEQAEYEGDTDRAAAYLIAAAQVLGALKAMSELNWD